MSEVNVSPLRGEQASHPPPGGAAAVEHGPAERSRLRSAPAMRRGDVYTRPVVDGRELRDTALTRLRDLARALLTSKAEREELDIESRLAELPGVTRNNTVAAISPKGGVGKTTSTFVLGCALCSALRLRAVAVDANPDYGTLAALAPDRLRAESSLAELLEDMGHLHSSSELHPYVSRLPSGLHLLAAPADPEAMAAMTPACYGKLLAFLGQYYDVVLLDCGTGITDPLARFAVARADHTLIVTTPEWVTASTVLGTLSHLEHERSTLIVNKAEQQGSGRRAIEARFRRERLARQLAIPYDERLATMLDSGTYSLAGLERRMRLAIKRLALAVGEELV